jgi:LEA14-like dessication related protein
VPRFQRLWPAVLVVLVSGCSLLQQVFQPPQARFDRAEFRALDFEALRVDLVLDLSNPNPVGARLSGYSMHFEVDGLTLVDGDIDQALDLRANASTELVLPTTLRWSELASRISRGDQGQEDLPFRAAGSLRVDTPVGEISIPYNIEGALPVIQPPRIEAVGLRVTNTSFTTVGLALELAITNPNRRSIGVTAFDYDLGLQSKQVLSGSIDQRVPVAAGARESRTVNVNLSLLEAGAALFALLNDGGQVDMSLSGRCEIETGYGTVPLDFEGAQGITVGR